MSQFVHRIAEIDAVQLERYRHRAFLRATMAGCALVAMANGRVSLGDRVHVDRVLETLDALKVFDPHEGVELFNDDVAGLQADASARRRALLDLVAEEPELLPRICRAASAPEHDIGAGQRQRQSKDAVSWRTAVVSRLRWERVRSTRQPTVLFSGHFAGASFAT